MNHRDSTIQDHKERINQVINYIRNHIGEPLKMKDLAKQSNYSMFHFHRIMRAYLGEPLGEYIKRVRMETAAFLLKLSEMQVAQIALKVGYENTPSFNKAFKARFGLSPNEYRQNANTEIEFKSFNNKIQAMKNLKSTEPKIKTLKPETVVYTTELGDYNKSAGIAWERINDFAKKNRLYGFRTNCYGISYDDPDVTESVKLRYDACISTTKKIEPQGDIAVRDLEGGKYAIFLHIGPYNTLKESYRYIFSNWILENNVELRDQPCMEKYINSVHNTKPEKLKTEIMIPIK